MSELLLERSQWDLIADASGNIAVCEDPYAIAQAVACECRLFLGEAWYDTTQGVPYNQEILTAAPNIGLIESLMATAAKKVTGVASARAMLYLDRSTRTVTGAVLVTTDSGIDLSVAV
ncbi:hypothetical protein [Novacetimonas pomaceti]|uniref:hypothetical protein n=1 Tax=Novacetimonas pomaceti TaxID=2021998 RepID=UPI001C2D8D90|nr:hypothetical protein [Novacetimonas pomaceti]MBV1833085.1 hypothetical protein [Novacetimonas pomaceti]